MGIIAWIVHGIIVGVIAERLISGRESHGVIVTCLIGVAGALLGGWLAAKLFHIHSLQGFFNISTWITTMAGAACAGGGGPCAPDAGEQGLGLKERQPAHHRPAQP